VTAVLALGSLPLAVGAATASITLKPSVGPPTTKVTVAGTGFGAGETVPVDFDATPVASATSSSSGSLSVTFKVPRAAVPGNHQVTAHGQTSGLTAMHTFLVRTNWDRFRFNLTNSGLNPHENVIGPSNVAGLRTAWTAATGSSIYASPAVANGVAYIGSNDDKLYAFSAAGTANCSGTPKTCTPLWTGATSGTVVSSPAVANGVVYVGSMDGKLYAFSASGTTKCSGIPKTCTPLSSAATGNSIIASSPAVAGGVVYVGSLDGKLYAFSASGSTNCSGTPKTCTPLWTAATGTAIVSSPAVATGVVDFGS